MYKTTSPPNNNKGISLTSINNVAIEFNDISPNETISNKEQLLESLIAIITHLKSFYQQDQLKQEMLQLLKLIFKYVGIQRQILEHQQLISNLKQLRRINQQLRDQHLQPDIYSYGQNRYQVYYDNNLKSENNKVYKLSVPQIARRLSSVFQKRTIFFDRHYFNLKSTDYKALCLNLLYFDSQYKKRVNDMISRRHGSDEDNVYTDPAYNISFLSHKIIGQITEPPQHLIRYINTLDGRWQVVHPSPDMANCYATKSGDEIICSFSNLYYSGMHTRSKYTINSIGDCAFTFSVYDDKRIVPIGQVLNQNQRQLIHIWPCPRNLELTLLQSQDQGILQYKKLSMLQQQQMFSVLYKYPGFSTPEFTHTNYRAWLLAQLHRGVYTNRDTTQLDGYKLSPAWYSHAYVPFDSFRGVYKNAYVDNLNLIDRSNINTNTDLKKDSRLIGLFNNTSSDASFGTYQEIRTRTDMFGKYAYYNEFDMMTEDMMIDYNQYPPLYNIAILPEHQTDLDFNKFKRLHYTRSLGLNKYYHPDRYICIPDKTNSLLSNKFSYDSDDHIYIGNIVQSGVSFDDHQPKRRILRTIRNNMRGWVNNQQAYISRQGADDYRSLNYDPSKVYGTQYYYPNDSNASITEFPLYKNTHLHLLHQRWMQYIQNTTSNTSLDNDLTAKSFLKKIIWIGNTAMYTSNIRVVSWDNSLIMRSNVDDAFIKKLNNRGIKYPSLQDKMGYYNSLIPNYLLSENVSLLTGQLQDKDYRTWKYHFSDGTSIISDSNNQSQYINYTYSNLSFNSDLGLSNKLAIIYTDHNSYDGYGFMNESGEYAITFKLKFGNRTADNVSLFNKEQLQLAFTRNMLKCCALPYQGLQIFPDAYINSDVSILPQDYVRGYKRLPGFFNNDLYDLISFKSNSTNTVQMCKSKLEQFKFMFKGYGQYITYMNNDKLYFQYNNKNYMELFSSNTSYIISNMDNQNWSFVTVRFYKTFQGNAILSWLYNQNIGSFSSQERYIAIKDVKVNLKSALDIQQWENINEF